MDAYVSPRRESVADHLAVARSRWRPNYPAWPEAAISPAFVEDLIREGIINGPKPVQKREGRGKGRRFEPRDYRELLEVIRVKLSGVKHRSGWIVHLWLRGHEYPIEVVRRALIDEVHATIDIAMRDFAPTRRFTEPFGVKFDRRVRRAGDENDVTWDFLEPLVAKMIRPNAITEITPNVGRMVDDLASISGIEADLLKSALTETLEAVKGGPNPSRQSCATLQQMFAPTPVGQLIKLMLTADPGAIQKAEAGIHGLIDDGAGRSGMVDAIRNAPEATLRRVRHLWVAIRSGSLEKLLLEGGRACPVELRTAFEAIQVCNRQQRLTNRSNPAMSAYIFGTYVSQW